MLNFHREPWNPVKKHSKALVFFAVSKRIPVVYSASPNHCSRHLGKINGLNSTYGKVWRCTFGRSTRVLMGKSWGKCCNAKLRCLSGLPSRKNSGKCRFNSIKDRPTCHRSLFQAYKFAMHIRTSRCDVTDYASV